MGLYSLSFENFGGQSLAIEMEIRKNNVVLVAKFFFIQNANQVFIFLPNIGFSPRLTFKFFFLNLCCNQSIRFLGFSFAYVCLNDSAEPICLNFLLGFHYSWNALASLILETLILIVKLLHSWFQYLKLEGWSVSVTQLNTIANCHCKIASCLLCVFEFTCILEFRYFYFSFLTFLFFKWF